MKIIIALLTLLLIASCSGLKKIKVSQIEVMWFEYSPNQDLNHGSKFNGEIMLQTYDGKQHEMSKNGNLSFISRDLRKNGRSGSYTIIKKSNAFNDKNCMMTLKYTTLTINICLQLMP